LKTEVFQLKFPVGIIHYEAHKPLLSGFLNRIAKPERYLFSTSHSSKNEKEFLQTCVSQTSNTRQLEFERCEQQQQLAASDKQAKHTQSAAPTYCRIYNSLDVKR
jgi:hypothetical protein